MAEIKAGVVVATKFCTAGADKFTEYVEYIDRDEATRNENSSKYNLYQDYMGNSEKTTGLFTSDKNELNDIEKKKLKDVFNAAQENDSLMWQTVISFDNEWLKQYGLFDKSGEYLDENKLKEVSRNAIKKMLEAEALENAVWSAAIHYNTDNVHVHIATVEPEPMREKKEYIQYRTKTVNGKKVKEPIIGEDGKPIKKWEYKGRFKQSSIETCKRSVVNEIVNEKENNLKINHIIRDSIIKQKQEHPLSKDKDLVQSFLQVYENMPDCNRNMWNYNNPIIAKVRNEIDDISKQYLEKYHGKEFKELEDRLKVQDELYRQSYGDSGKSYYDGKVKDLYTRLGNAVLKEIREYDSLIKNGEIEQGVTRDPQEKSAYKNQEFFDFIEKQISKTEDDIDMYIAPEVEQEESYYKWSNEYKKAKKLLHGKKPDYKAAYSLLISEHQKGNILASYELGDMFRYGRGVKLNIDIAEQYYKESLYGFENSYNNQEDTESGDDAKIYLAYRIGKQYYYGLGTEQDYEAAKEWFETSGNKYANYMLGKMAYYGQGMDKDYDIAFTYFSSIEGNPYADYKAASMLDNNEVNENIAGNHNKDEYYKRAFMGFMAQENKQADDNLEYRIGIMYLSGLGIEQNADIGKEYLEMSAEAGNTYAMNKLAMIYLDEGNEEQLPKAIEYLNIAATKGNNSMAQYTLGNIYSAENYGMKDIQTAINWYSKAEKAGNEFASYKLGKIYLQNEDYNNAIEHLKLCNNKYAYYSLSKIYLDKELEVYNLDEGIKYLEMAANEGNEFASYRLGKIYNSDEYGMQDIDKAIYWYEKAENAGNEFASYNLGKIYYEQGDYNQAILKFEKCQNEFAYYYIGKIYLDKDGTVFNPDKGIEYMLKSAEMGNQYAELSLGFIYLKGEVVQRDKAVAKEWFEKAATQGNELAEEILNNFDNYANKSSYRTRSIYSASVLSKAIQAMKKSMKEEWQKRQNEREHDMLLEYMNDER